MKVFLDTNGLVSAFATRGLCADVLRVVLFEHELVTSEDVLTKLREALVAKLSVPSRTVLEILAMLRAHLVEQGPSTFTPLGLRDVDDERIAAAAKRAGSDVLVTGDCDILDFSKKIQGVQILSPRGFWEMLGQGK